ncbi:MAG: hypothetical protein AB7E70_20385 [Hyphomicrobiaceae bacterium]
MSGVAELTNSGGTVTLKDVEEVIYTAAEQDADAVRQGPPGRTDRQGLRQYKAQSLDGGLGILRGLEVAHSNRYRSSQGLWAQQQNGLFLPPRLQAQATLHATNISGSVAANLRVHGLDTTLGQSKRRPYFWLGKKMYRAVSDSDHSLQDAGLTFTNNTIGVIEAMVGGSRAIVGGSDGTTDDVWYMTDPTASPPTKSTLIALSSGDWLIPVAWFATMGASGILVLQGKYGGTNGLWFLNGGDAALTTPQQVVDTATKDSANSDAITVTSGPHYPKSVVDVGAVAGAATGAITNLTNVLVADGSYCSFANSGGHGIAVGDFDLVNYIPSNAVPVGFLPEMRAQEDNAAGDFYVSKVYQSVDGQPVTGTTELSGQIGFPRVASLSGNEWALDTAGTPYSDLAWYGSADLGAAHVTAEIWRRHDYSLGFVIGDSGTSIRTGRIDYVRSSFYYKPTGYGVSLPLGGWVVGPDPLDPFSVYVVAPEFQDETGSVNVPRILWKLAMAYDADGARPTVTLTKVVTTMNHVETAAFGMGGIGVAGDSSAGLGKVFKLLRRGDGLPVNLNFGGQQGYTENWGIVNVWGADEVFVVQVALEDFTVQQDWLCDNGKWHPIGPRETIAASPIRNARPVIGTNLRRRYRFWPSSTNTAVTRTFQPKSYFASPLTTDTTEVKANGVLTITLPDMDIGGPEEQNKSLLTAWCLSRDVSATSTIRLRYSTDGAANFTTWATFTAYGTKSTLSPPVTYRSLCLEIGLDNSDDTAATPNGLPILIEVVSRWRPLRRFVLFFDPDDEDFKTRFPGGIQDVFAEMETLVNANPAMTLRTGIDSKTVTWDGLEAGFVPNLPGEVPDPTGKKAKLILTEVAS